MADRKMQVERGNLAPYIVVNRDAAVAGVFSVDGERGSVSLEGKYAKVSDLSASNKEIENLKPRITAVESGLNETNITVKKIDDTLDKVEPASVIFNRDVLAKEIGVGYPRVGTSPSTRFGYHNTSATTPRLFIANGNVGKTIQFPFDDGTMATREWTNQYVGPTISSGSQLQTQGTTTSVAVNRNGNAGIWSQESNRWLLRMNNQSGAADVTKNIFLIDQDAGSTSSKIEISSPDRANRIGIWSYNDKRNLISGYKDGSWTNVDIPDIATKESSGNIGGRATNITNEQLNSLSTTGTRFFMQGGGTDNYFSTWGAGLNISYDLGTAMRLFIWGNSGKVTVNVRSSDGTMYWNDLWGTKNTTVDGNGFLKKASPIVKIYKYGDYDVNDESKGATVKHVAKGVYKISGVLGLNSDGAWGGSEGGIEIPMDTNKQPRVWVDYSVEKNGDITVKTYHREHLNSPSFAQNKIEGFSDGDPINIPVGTFISVRVQMPENSDWNLKQKELEELNKKELDNGKEILNSDN